MSVTSGGTAPKPFSSGGSRSGSAGSAGISITLRIFHCPFPLPPSRCQSQIGRGEVFQTVTTPTNPYGLGGIVRRPQFQHHLLLRTEIQHLQMAALAQVPDVHRVTVFAAEQELRVDAVLRPCSACPTRW